MKELPYRVNVLLTIEVGLVCLTGLLVQAFVPAAILPRPGVPMLVLLSAIPLAAETFLGPGKEGSAALSALMAGTSFGLLPWCAGLTLGQPPWWLFLVGSAVFAVVAPAYRSMPVPGKEAPLAPVLNVLGFYLASQGFQGFW